MHPADCKCNPCSMTRLVYVLMRAYTEGKILLSDYEWALLTLSTMRTLEEIA